VTETEQAIADYIRSEFLRDQPDAVLATDEPLIQTGVIDSLGIFLLIGFLEERFNVTVDPKDVVLDNFETIDAITALVNARRTSNTSSER
jgi:acyl carrier protein